MKEDREDSHITLFCCFSPVCSYAQQAKVTTCRQIFIYLNEDR